MGSDYEQMRAERDRLKVLSQEKELQRKKAAELCETMRLERDRLASELAESERLRTEAFASCEAMRLERDEWKAAVEYQQQQVTQLRKQVEHLEAAIDDVQGINKTIAGQLADADAQIRQFEQIEDTRDELQASLRQEKRETQVWRRSAETWQQQVAELQAQLEAAAVTPAQQPDGNAAVRLEAVRRMIGEIWGWYACVGRLDGMTWAEAWEQVGALLGHLQQEAG